MKIIEVFFSPENGRETELTEALVGKGLDDIDDIICERVKGKGQKPNTDGTPLPRIKFQLHVENEQVDSIVQTIVRVLRKGNIGDGKIFVLPVEEVKAVYTRPYSEV